MQYVQIFPSSPIVLPSGEDSCEKEPGTADLTVTRAKIVIDTTDGRKTVATVLESRDTGWVAEFKRDQIPGDQRGDIVLVAKIDDNDTYGNLLQELKVPLGAKRRRQIHSGQGRSLYATRDKAPMWLLPISYSIVLCVGSVLLFLVINLFKIRKMGKAGSGEAA